MTPVLNALYAKRDDARARQDKDLLSICIFLIGELERLDKAKRGEQALLAILRKTREAELSMAEYHPNATAFNVSVIDELLEKGPKPATVRQMEVLVELAGSLKDLMALASKAEKEHNIIVDKKVLKSMWEPK